MTKRELNVISGISLVIAVGIVLLALKQKIDVAQAISLIVTIILVAVTAVNVMLTGNMVKATTIQAEASLKMAKEMENQRYGAVRPVLDILVKPLTAPELTKMAYTEKEQLKLPEAMICEFLNVGIGPAIDIYYFTVYDNTKIRQELVALKVQDKSPEVLLYLDKRDENYYSVVNYSDMYGRKFESIRQIMLDRNNKTYEVGSLQTSRIREVKNQSD